MTDQQYLQLAMVQAKKGRGHTWQNPVVGAVIVKHDRVLAMGYHHEYGQAHAEVDAISHLNSPAEAKDATMYVTLEPCSHYGKTPPCANKLIELGFKRVVIGQLDPNPLVAGKGVDRLCQHGVQVTVLDTTRSLNEAYNFYYEHQRPLITVKYAMSLDGKINQAGKQRTQLTSSATFQDTQRLRLAHQAILIGERTLQIDHPKLTVRSTPKFAPRRLVLVRDASNIDYHQPLFQAPGPVYILASKPAKQPVPSNTQVMVNTQWTPRRIVDFLAKQGLQSLLIEGGSHTHATFVQAGLVDRLVVYLAPIIIGGTGLPSVLGPGIQDFESFEMTSVSQIGPDVKVTARRQKACLQVL